MKLRNYALALVLIFPQALLAEQKLDLANPGFEDGESSWSISKNEVSAAVMPDAAHTGKLGLRITDKSYKEGAFVASASMPSSAGKKYRLTFWGRNIEGATTAVYFLFFDAQQKLIQIPEHSDGIRTNVDGNASAWKQYSLLATAPAETAYVKIWIHSGNVSLVVTDIDDLELYDVSQ